MLNKSKRPNLFYTLLLIFISIIFEVFILMETSKVEIIIGLNGVLFIILFMLVLNKNLYNTLIVLYFLPLIFLNNSVHYQLKYELVFALPLFTLFLYTIALKFSASEKKNQITYLTKPLYLFLIYFFVVGIYGIFQNHNKSFILFEGFHFLLFGGIFLFNYHFNERHDFYLIFKSLLIIFLIISLEYIFLGAVISGNRFVTFQSGFLPFVSGILFSFFLFAKNSINKTIYAVLLFIVITAMISTLTRSLWVTTGITLLLVYVTYLWSQKKLTFFKKIIFLAFGLGTIVLVVTTISNSQPTGSLGDSEKVEERAQSIASPTEDHSFLMRVELGWYALQKFSEKPIFGWGLGDYLKFQFLGNTKLKNIYIDNSWFYFLWKGGMIGFSLITFIFFRSLKLGLRIILGTDNNIVKSIVVGIVAGSIGIILLGLLSPLIIKYRTNVLFPLVWSYLEFEYSRLQNLGTLK